MLLVTNRPSVYVLIDGVTVELEVDVPTEVPDCQGEKLIKRGICMPVVDEPKQEFETVEATEEVSEAIEPEPESPKKASKKK